MGKDKCNPFAGGEIPPCSELLGNSNPIIKDGEAIFTNNNRLFFFISTNSVINNKNNNCSLGNSNVQTNLQISLATFLIGIYINEVELGNIDHSSKNTIHNDNIANNFINETLKSPPEVTVDYIPSLNMVISNHNAVLPLYSNTINISPLNYYILFILNRLESDPGLFFGNNAYVSDDPINFSLANLALRFPFE